MFDDTELTAFQVKVQRIPNGSLLWSGKLPGVEDSQIILVVRDRNVFASIYLPARAGKRNERIIYQIRPVDQAIGRTEPGGMLSKGAKASSTPDPSPMHVIREIYCGWKTANGVRGEEGKIIELVNLERAADGIPVLQFESLMSSPSHRATIIDPDFTQIGVGHTVSLTGAYHHFWAQEFGAGDQRERTSSLGAADSRRIVLSF